MCECVCVNVRVCDCVRPSLSLSLSLSERKIVWTYVYMCVNMYGMIHVCLYVSIDVCSCENARTFMYMLMHILVPN